MPSNRLFTPHGSLKTLFRSAFLNASISFLPLMVHLKSKKVNTIEMYVALFIPNGSFKTLRLRAVLVYQFSFLSLMVHLKQTCQRSITIKTYFYKV